MKLLFTVLSIVVTAFACSSSSTYYLTAEELENLWNGTSCGIFTPSGGKYFHPYQVTPGDTIGISDGIVLGETESEISWGSIEINGRRGRITMTGSARDYQTKEILPYACIFTAKDVVIDSSDWALAKKVVVLASELADSIGFFTIESTFNEWTSVYLAVLGYHTLETRFGQVLSLE